MKYTPLPVDEMRVYPTTSSLARVLETILARWGDIPVAVQAARADGLPDGTRCTEGVEIKMIEDERLTKEWGGRCVGLR